jgi:hypothetical protein
MKNMRRHGASYHRSRRGLVNSIRAWHKKKKYMFNLSLRLYGTSCKIRPNFRSDMMGHAGSNLCTVNKLNQDPSAHSYGFEFEFDQVTILSMRRWRKRRLICYKNKLD